MEPILKAFKKDDELPGEYLCETVGINLCILFTERNFQQSQTLNI